MDSPVGLTSVLEQEELNNWLTLDPLQHIEVTLLLK